MTLLSVDHSEGFTENIRMLVTQFREELEPTIGDQKAQATPVVIRVTTRAPLDTSTFAQVLDFGTRMAYRVAAAVLGDGRVAVRQLLIDNALEHEHVIGEDRNPAIEILPWPLDEGSA